MGVMEGGDEGLGVQHEAEIAALAWYGLHLPFRLYV